MATSSQSTRPVRLEPVSASLTSPAVRRHDALAGIQPAFVASPHALERLVLVTFLVVFRRALCLWILGVLHQRGIGVARTLVVGDSTVGRMIMQALAGRPHLGYEVAGFLSTDGDADFGRFRRLGTPDELERIIHQERIAQVVIALPSTSHEAIMRIVNHCRRDGVQFRLVPDLYEVSLGSLDIDTLSGIPLMGMKDHAILGVNFLMKRVIDVAISLIVLILFSWFFGALALLIWVE